MIMYIENYKKPTKYPQELINLAMSNMSKYRNKLYFYVRAIKYKKCNFKRIKTT